MTGLSFPPRYSIYEEAKRVWNEKQHVTTPSRDLRPTSATAVTGSKRRAPIPDQPGRPTPVRWDEDDASMEDFAPEGAVETDNSAVIAFMQDIKNRVLDSLNDLVSQDLPQETFASAPACPSALATARTNAYTQDSP
ncbi:hypothetical protein ACEPAF_3255 [Sanghuangporus sanghuang]